MPHLRFPRGAILRVATLLGMLALGVTGASAQMPAPKQFAPQATNTLLGNETSGTAVPSALTIGSCSGGTNALTWTTNTGFGCHTLSGPTTYVACTNASTDSAAINVALVALPATGGTVTPYGTCDITATIVVTTGQRLIGSGSGNGPGNPNTTYQGTIFVVASGLGDADVIAAGNVVSSGTDTAAYSGMEIAYISILPTALRTSTDAGIHLMNPNGARVHDIQFARNFSGPALYTTRWSVGRDIYVDCGTTANLCYANWIDHITANSGYDGILIGNPSSTTTGGLVEDLWVSDTELNGSLRNDAIEIPNCSGCTLTNTGTEAAGNNGVELDPGNNQEVDMAMVGGGVDGMNNYGFYLNASGTGAITGVQLSNVYIGYAGQGPNGGGGAFSNSAASGMAFGTGGTITHVVVSNSRFYANAAAGVYIAGSNTTEATFTGCEASGNNNLNGNSIYGGYLLAGGNHITITGGDANATGIAAHQQYGIYVGASYGSYLTISGVDLVGNGTSGLGLGSTPANLQVVNSPGSGYGPVANVNIANTWSSAQTFSAVNVFSASNTWNAAQNFSNGASGPLTGITSGSNAASGVIGEDISSQVLNTSAVTLTSGTIATVTTISLTAGDWDVQGIISFNTGTSVSEVIGSVNSAATGPSNPPGGHFDLGFPGGTSVYITSPTGIRRFNVTTTTTIYLLATATFAGTEQAYGYISARRVR